MEQNWFPTATPESQGIPSSAILSFIEECEKERIGIDALIIMRHGKIVTEGYWAPFRQGDPHRMFSSAKAIVAVAILIAIDEGRLSLDDPITKFFKDSLPENYSERFDRMTVYNLLTMHTGHKNDPFGMMIKEGGDRARTFLSYAPEYEPGTHFMYNNGVPDILGLILYNLTGQRVLEYLEDRLFKPLGMDGMNAERYGHLDELPTITCSTRSLLKLSYLLKNHGRWNGQQIISEKLADMAGSYLVPSLQDPDALMIAHDTKFGYGFQIWRNSVGGFRIDGGRGQFGIVLPDCDLIIAINATESDQQVLPLLVWKHITNRLFAVPMAEDNEAYNALTKKLSSLTCAEKGSAQPSPSVWGNYALSEEFFGTKNISVSADESGLVTLKTDLLASPVQCGKLNGGEWTVIPKPLSFETQRFGSGLGKDNVSGSVNNDVLICAACREESSIELHLRSRGTMGGKVVTLLGDAVTYTTYDEFAVSRRSESVKHPDMAKLPKKEPVSVSAVKG